MVSLWTSFQDSIILRRQIIRYSSLVIRHSSFVITNLHPCEHWAYNNQLPHSTVDRISSIG